MSRESMTMSEEKSGCGRFLEVRGLSAWKTMLFLVLSSWMSAAEKPNIVFRDVR